VVFAILRQGAGRGKRRIYRRWLCPLCGQSYCSLRAAQRPFLWCDSSKRALQIKQSCFKRFI